jgi:DNA-binding LytR/AlgR family response regulator
MEPFLIYLLSMAHKTKRILIAEDEIIIAEYISDLLIELDCQYVKMAHDEETILNLIHEWKPELVLLDIRMKDKLIGLSIAELLHSKFKIPFIYISANSERNIIEQAIATMPLGYITKPIRKTDLFAMVSLAFAEQDSKDNTLLFKDGYDVIRIQIKDIIFAQSEGNYITIFTTDKKYVIRQTLDWLSEQLNPDFFLRCHRSFIVNWKKVSKLGNKVILLNSQVIPVSRQNWSDIKNRFSSEQ